MTLSSWGQGMHLELGVSGFQPLLLILLLLLGVCIKLLTCCSSTHVPGLHACSQRCNRLQKQGRKPRTQQELPQSLWPFFAAAAHRALPSVTGSVICRAHLASCLALLLGSQLSQSPEGRLQSLQNTVHRCQRPGWLGGDHRLQPCPQECAASCPLSAKMHSCQHTAAEVGCPRDGCSAKSYQLLRLVCLIPLFQTRVSAGEESFLAL